MQEHLQNAANQFTHSVFTWRVPLPECQGSRTYGLSTSSSDLDLYLVVGKEVVDRGAALLSLFGNSMLDAKCAVDLPAYYADGSEHHTKWQHLSHGLEVSLRITADRESGECQLRTTICLRACYEADVVYREVVVGVIEELRQQGLLNSEPNAKGLSLIHI